MTSPHERLRAELRAVSDRAMRRVIAKDRRQRHANRLHRELLQKQRFGTLLILLGPAVLALVLAIPADGGRLPYLFAIATSVIGAGFRDRVSARIRRARTDLTKPARTEKSPSTPPGHAD